MRTLLTTPTMRLPAARLSIAKSSIRMPSIMMLSIALLSITMIGCQRDAGPPAPAAGTLEKGAYAVQAWPLPSQPGDAQPDLVATADGRVLLSWISSVQGRRNALRFVALGSNGHWQSPPRTIVVGAALLANWADTPHIAATADGALWVQWLQKPVEGGGEASDIMLSRSVDGGFNWSPPALVNTDGTATEHGFVSLWAQSTDQLGVAWLDGRGNAGNATSSTHDDAGDDAGDTHDGGGMMLRAAIFDRSQRRSGETQLDALACDCCQTGVAVTNRGPLLVYRDRTPEEIRDISMVRLDNDTWTAPMPVHADGWRMPACPVNGPAIAAQGNAAVVAWYTAAGDTPTIKLARSDDAGDSFAAPVVVDQGDAVQGRVDVALDAQQAWVLWLREEAGGQSLWLARYAPDLSRELQRIKVADLQGRGRGTGFPQLAVNGGAAFVVWTDVAEGASTLHGAVVAAR